MKNTTAEFKRSANMTNGKKRSSVKNTPWVSIIISKNPPKGIIAKPTDARNDKNALPGLFIFLSNWSSIFFIAGNSNKELLRYINIEINKPWLSFSMKRVSIPKPLAYPL